MNAPLGNSSEDLTEAYQDDRHDTTPRHATVSQATSTSDLCPVTSNLQTDLPELYDLGIQLTLDVGVQADSSKVRVCSSIHMLTSSL
jgi:hypothetical protein